jgi:hypothetical protein
MQLGPRMVWSRETASPEAHSFHAEVSAILLDPNRL